MMTKELDCLEKIIDYFNEPQYELGVGYFCENELIESCEDEVNTIKQALLEKQKLDELLKKLGFKDEYTFKKIMQIMVDGVFYDDRGERYETPSLYYDNGLCIIDADTGGCGVGIENYGKAFAREFEEIER